ncbi:hypothetical protein ACRAVF_27615 [Bradyrhizobium oligotrophicum S58]
MSLTSASPVVYDFDRIEAWCNNPTVTAIDHTEFLDAWNMLDDAHGPSSDLHSPYRTISRAAGHVYDKLFWANNLTAVTPVGSHYDPIWSADEIELMSRVFRLGLAELRTVIR